MFLLGFGIFRLFPIAMDAFSYQLEWYHQLCLVANVSYLAYAEGYRGFQKKFSPRVVARMKYLKSNPNMKHTLLAPLFCMGYICSTKQRKILNISLLIGIVFLIVLIRFLNQPWRGIIDVGVVIGLVWGVCSIFLMTIKAFVGGGTEYNPEIPQRC